MNTYKILIVEKDLLARQAISKVIKKHGKFQVVTTASGVRGTESYIADNKPDVVLLNLEKPDSEEFEFLTKLRVRHPELPVIVLSPRNEEGAKVAITALSMGAVDVVTKPNRCNNLLFANRHLNKRLIPIIETAVVPVGQTIRKEALGDTGQYSQKDLEQVRKGWEDSGKKIFKAGFIAVGGCFGGPKSLFAFITKLPGDLPVPVVVVQHFPKIYTKILADELNRRSRLRVREAYDGAELAPGIVWIAPGGYQTEIHQEGSKTTLRTHRGPRELGNRPSINILFRSAAKYFGNKTLGIVLSGIGMDGLSGAEAIRTAGGEILVQDPQFSPAPEMPLRILQAGISRKMCKAENFVDEILSRVPDKPDYVIGKSFAKESKLHIQRGIDSMDRMEFNAL